MRGRERKDPQKEHEQNDPRCSDWQRCWRGVSHGSARPERWAENGDKAPWWVHSQSWYDVHDALDRELPVFTDRGQQIQDEADLMNLQMGATITDCRQVLIPASLFELREQEAIESILNQK